MLRRNQSETLACLAAMTLALGSSAAFAQANPELGETGAAAGASAQADTSGSTSAGGQATWQPPTGNQMAAAGSEPAAETTEETAPGDTDHASVVGHFGVGFFGIMRLPAMGCGGGPGCTPATADVTYGLDAPTIGMRYWLEPGMGVEAALGFGIESGGTTTTTTGGTAGSVDTNAPSYVGVGLHGGIPLVFAESKHFAFELVPELNFSFVSGSWDSGPANVDASLSGLMFQLGARVGAEIQFGFIDIPQLALQGTIGLHLTVVNRSIESENTPAAGTTTENSVSSFRFATSVQDEPWDIFVGGLTAIYYF